MSAPINITRLKPSDSAKITNGLKDPNFLSSLVASFCSYLESLSAPSAVDEDDVIRITLQLKAAGLWDKVSAPALEHRFSRHTDSKVWESFREALGFQSTMHPPNDAVIEAAYALLHSRKPSGFERSSVAEQDILRRTGKALKTFGLPDPLRLRHLFYQAHVGVVESSTGHFVVIKPDDGSDRITVDVGKLRMFKLSDLHAGDRVTYSVKRSSMEIVKLSKP